MVTFSWQKALGGEAGHGMLVLQSARAVARLWSYTPAWPLPKIFRMTKGGKLNEVFLRARRSIRRRCGASRIISTPRLGKSVGGLKALISRADNNIKVLADWKAKTPWIDFLAGGAGDPLQHPGVPEGDRSRDCLADPGRAGRTSSRSWSGWSRRKARATTSRTTAMCRRACASGAARPSKASDVALLTQWIDWAFAETKVKLRKAA